jgi:hypothetical protein
VPKEGHVCSDGKMKAATPSPPIPDAVLPVPTPLVREQYDDMLEFSTPPTDAEVLAFLRKYDLKPSEATDVHNSMEAYQQAAARMIHSRRR